MSHYSGWSDVTLEPAETREQRAEGFRRGMAEVDQAGDMLAELQADLESERRIADYWEKRGAELERDREHALRRAARWKAAAKEYRSLYRDEDDRSTCLWADAEEARRQRDVARAALERITADAGL